MDKLPLRRRSASALLAALFALAIGSHAAHAEENFKRIALQYLAALGDPNATSGTGAEAWGMWTIDPGPRGVRLESFGQLKATGGVAPAGWSFNADDWWLEENGLIMEPPDFAVAPGKYLVTGDREVTSVLTIHAVDKDGSQRWELDKGAKLYDVTHLPCRSARYRPASKGASCSPSKAKASDFRVPAGAAMPAVEGCSKQDYAVLFVIGVRPQWPRLRKTTSAPDASSRSDRGSGAASVWNRNWSYSTLA